MSTGMWGMGFTIVNARMRKLLKGLIAECESGKRPRSCPIIATLSAGA